MLRVRPYGEAYPLALRHAVERSAALGKPVYILENGVPDAQDRIHPWLIVNPVKAECSGEAGVALGRAHFAIDCLAVGIFRGDFAQPLSARATRGGEFVHRTQRLRRIVDACPGQYSARFVRFRRRWRGGTLARVAHRLDALG